MVATGSISVTLVVQFLCGNENFFFSVRNQLLKKNSKPHFFSPTKNNLHTPSHPMICLVVRMESYFNLETSAS